MSRRAMGEPARLGWEGERLAYRLLVREGYDVLLRNWQAPFGEVDLIARREGVVHFVEVKTRRRNPDFRPERRVDDEKQDRLRQLARYFLKMNGWTGLACRFHVVSIEVGDDRRAEIRLITNAF